MNIILHISLINDPVNANIKGDIIFPPAFWTELNSIDNDMNTRQGDRYESIFDEAEFLNKISNMGSENKATQNAAGRDISKVSLVATVTQVFALS